MAKDLSEPENRFDLGEEKRTERLKWLFYGVFLMVLVPGNFFLQDRVQWRFLNASSLTILFYGFVVYVHEIKHIRESWLWKGVVTTIPLHVAFISSLTWWDARYPPHLGFAFTNRLFIVFALELLFVLPILEHFRPPSISADVKQDENSPPTTNRSVPQLWLAAADRLRGRVGLKTAERPDNVGPIISIAGEEDIDSAEVKREGYFNWCFGIIAALLLGIYLFTAIALTGARLYVLKASLFTAYCYGHLFYVADKDHIRESWVWKVALAAFPFHIAFFGIIVGFDRAAPVLAPNPFVFLFVLWASGWIETKLMDQMTDDFQP